MPKLMPIVTGAGAAGGTVLAALPIWLAVIAGLAPPIVAWIGGILRDTLEWRQERSDWDWLAQASPAVRRDALELRRINVGRRQDAAPAVRLPWRRSGKTAKK